MQAAKETAANIGASAKSGMEKTKATVQEKVEKMTAHDPFEKEMATQKKEERMTQAELSKREAREHNAATKQAATSGPTGTGTGTYTHSTAGAAGHATGPRQVSALPGHGTGHPAGGYVCQGTAAAHPPSGVETGPQIPQAGTGVTGYGTAGNVPGYGAGGGT